MFEVGKDIIKSINVPAGSASHGRLRFVYSVFVVLFVMFAVQTLRMGVKGTNLARRGSGAGAWVSLRADIVDRTGDILAKNIMSGHIVLRPALVRNSGVAARLVNEVVPEISTSDVLRDIESGKKFIYIKRLASDEQRAAVKAAKIPGISVEETERRKYPKQRLFSHLVGFVGTDMKGLEGIERLADKYILENKDPLVLSVDSRVQSVFYQELSKAMQTYGARGAIGILMNSATGEIIAMVSLPDFDPEDINSEDADRRKFLPMRGIYEMGSSFKIFNTAMAAEYGIGLDKEYNVGRPYKVANTTISDIASFKPPRPNLSVREIMLHSSNVGSVQIALDLPAGAAPDFFSKIYMDRALDLEFGRTERTLLPAKWGPVERATVSFGHGIAVTPMHLLLAVNAMVNGGIYVWPTIYRRGPGPVEGKRVISPELSKELREIMFKTAEEGSVRKARIKGINIGGKTSTAEKRVNGIVDKTKNLTSFIGAFPIESPGYVMLVMLDEPKGTPESFGLRTAAWNAVPTAGAILDSILPMLFN
ncbi:MAG: penicillin-binding protein 2 [Alphaproteobacteria bacterium]|nr:penicillin-binding protein 2 [Alphaproteobacteria bacterium]